MLKIIAVNGTAPFLVLVPPQTRECLADDLDTEITMANHDREVIN